MTPFHPGNSAPRHAPIAAPFCQSGDCIATRAFGQPFEVATGLWWLRLPLAHSASHVNVYVLDDGDQWTLVDTGHNSAECRWALKLAFSQWPLSTKPLGRVIATHYHHDHIGLAGELVDRGAVLWTTRTSWLTASLLQANRRVGPSESLIQFAQSAGLAGQLLDTVTSGVVNFFPRLATPLPTSYRRIADGDTLMIGTRRWTVTTCDGHAAEHAMLWSDDGLLLSGDQILFGLTARVAIYHSEPDADPVGEWLAAAQRVTAMGDETSLVLPGHQLPFTGVSSRCRQILSSYDSLLNRLLDLLATPKTAVSCLEPIYRRPVTTDELLSLSAEMMGYLGFLSKHGLVQRISGLGNATMWRRTATQRCQHGIRFASDSIATQGRLTSLGTNGQPSLLTLEGVRR